MCGRGEGGKKRDLPFGGMGRRKKQETNNENKSSSELGTADQLFALGKKAVGHRDRSRSIDICPISMQMGCKEGKIITMESETKVKHE